MQQPSQHNEITHAILTCADDRIDPIVDREIERIRHEGGRLRWKNVTRVPGGVHLLAGDSDCRPAYYKYLSAQYKLFGTTMFHVWPHTNCQECGLHRPQKIGSGTKSDLWFHLKSAERLLHGSQEHFGNLPDAARPRFDVQVILTIDQRMVTIEEGHVLLSKVPEDIPHGLPCLHARTGEHHRHSVPHPVNLPHDSNGWVHHRTTS